MGRKVTEKAAKPKTKHGRGLRSPEEDQRLRDYILKYGHGCWSSIPANAGNYLKKKMAKPESVDPREKRVSNSDATNSSSFEEPRHRFSYNPAKPTDMSSLTRCALFAAQNNNINDIAHGGSLLDYYHCYEDDDLMRMVQTETMDCNTNLLQDSVIQNAIFGGHANGAFRREELIDGSYMKMEDQSSESGFLLDFTPKDSIYSSNEFFTISNLM